MQDVSQLLGDIASLCSVDMVWVPSHCGLVRNELVDRLAKDALNLSVKEQIDVPIDYEDVRRRVKIKSCANPLLSEVPKSLEAKVSLREAKVSLAQLAVGHTPCLLPLGSYMLKKRFVCRCRPGVLNDVNHYLLHCPQRTASRRMCLPPLRDRIEIWLDEIMGYTHLLSSGIFGFVQILDMGQVDLESKAGHLAAFSVTTVGTLRGIDCEEKLRKILSQEDVRRVLSSTARPDYCVDVVRAYLIWGETVLIERPERNGCSSLEHLWLLWHLRTMLKNSMECQRIVKVPLPFGYVQHTFGDLAAHAAAGSSGIHGMDKYFVDCDNLVRCDWRGTLGRRAGEPVRLRFVGFTVVCALWPRCLHC
eukprot:TRINITY_DN849_c0_g1_i1.p1 TRINITY_DN849_c0_g1~~TRINITY_DN849_c0_g1_i1.p1  ORF type:complete len:362 (+),score=31.50 TRINITY_DN849_c0_g1_i1:628-1713(+)